MNPNGSKPVPDLETVLRNLAALTGQPAPPPAPQEPVSQALHSQPIPQIPPSHTTIGNPNGYQGALFDQSPGLASLLGAEASTYPSHLAAPVRTTTPMIDPATITQWSQGLRCVSKIAAQNPNFKNLLRTMMLDQDKHERIWWQGREAIMEKHKIVAGQNESTYSESAKEELKCYDEKVYRAAKAMANSMSTELKQLGVPFFGVKSELIIVGEKGNAASQARSSSGARITEEELRILQQRMVQYLEDMYKM